MLPARHRPNMYRVTYTDCSARHPYDHLLTADGRYLLVLHLLRALLMSAELVEFSALPTITSSLVLQGDYKVLTDIAQYVCRISDIPFLFTYLQIQDIQS